MKGEKIFDGITGIRDEIVEKAGAYEFKSAPKRSSRTWVRWVALAAAVCLVVGVGVGVWQMLTRPMGDKKPMYYAYDGPILPLTAGGDVSGIEVERHINMDLSEFGKNVYNPHSLIADSYVLTNTTSEDVVMKAVYGFTGSLNDDVKCMPDITVDGKRVETTLYAGGGDYEEYYAKVSENFGCIEDYKAVLQNADYMERALDLSSKVNQNVTVYKISGDYDSEDASDIAIWYGMDQAKTKVYTYGFVSMEANVEDNRYCARAYVPDKQDVEYGHDKFLIVVGDDIQVSDILCSKAEADEEGVASDASQYVSRYVAPVDEVLKDVAQEMLEFNKEAYEEVPMLHMELTAEAMGAVLLQTLSDFGVFDMSENDELYNRMLEYETAGVSAQRIMYVTWEVTIPAGNSVDVVATMNKAGHKDANHKQETFAGYTDCYDLLTKLSSDLDYTAQTASISGADMVDIVEQNYGFDVKNGITKVQLDMSCEHYYMKIRD